MKRHGKEGKRRKKGQIDKDRKGMEAQDEGKVTGRKLAGLSWPTLFAYRCSDIAALSWVGSSSRGDCIIEERIWRRQLLRRSTTVLSQWATRTSSEWSRPPRWPACSGGRCLRAATRSPSCWSWSPSGWCLSAWRWRSSRTGPERRRSARTRSRLLAQCSLVLEDSSSSSASSSYTSSTSASAGSGTSTSPSWSPPSCEYRQTLPVTVNKPIVHSIFSPHCCSYCITLNVCWEPNSWP